MNHRRRMVTAIVLWLVFAFVVWNVVFDRIVVLAGRRYSHDAMMLYRTTGRYLRIDDVMRPAVSHGLWVASSVALAIVAGAMVLIRLAALRDSARSKR